MDVGLCSDCLFAGLGCLFAIWEFLFGGLDCLLLDWAVYLLNLWG